MTIKPTNPIDAVLLAPHSGTQFIEYSLNLDTVGRFSRRFIERSFVEEEFNGDIPIRLLQGWDENEPSQDSDGQDRPDDIIYAISREKALEPFLNKWTPVPFLRIRHGRTALGQETYDKGPTNWARLRVVEDPSRKTSGAHYIAIFAFDTELAPKAVIERDGIPYPYTTPLYADAENPREFRFVSAMSQLGWFLADPQPVEGSEEREDYQAWVLEWVDELFREFKQAQRGTRPLRAEDFPYRLEHAARWFAFLQLLDVGLQPQKIRFMDTISAQPTQRPIEVDLVLDIGNSRTCGILIENYPNQESADLADARVLELRDVSRPEIIYSEPFESRVEFAQAWFGMDHLSRLSGRTRAFFWPSLMRVGPEANRFRSQKTGTEPMGGMSSPKRYLWDVNPVNQEWRFPQKDYTAEGMGPPVERAIRSLVNSTGEVLSQLRNPRRSDKKLFQSLYAHRRPDDFMRSMGARLTFSRSSIYTLMLVEIFWQAWVMINSERCRHERRDKAVPRRLRRIVLTLPPTTPVREQRIMMARAQGAIDLIWDLTGWRTKAPPGIQQPIVQVAWDEATCVQFVWMYGQIARNFGGRINDFMKLVGRPRARVENDAKPNGKPLESSLRVASIDIGGGTTDLMVTTYYHDNDRQIIPSQTFREGFRLAGDDLVLAIIEYIVIQAFESAMTNAGARDARQLLAERFGTGRAGMAEQEKQLRREFVLRVLEPVAMGLMQAYEENGSNDQIGVATKSVRDFLGASSSSISPQIHAYLEAPARSAGATDFSILDVMVPLDFAAMCSVIMTELEKVLDNLTEAVNALDCDMVLLSGRPSRLPAIIEALTNRLAVSPDRLMPLHAFQAGDWYPFRGRNSRSIADPKTAVVVGATLCLLGEHQLQNFRLATERIQMRSTARFIGELELGRQLKKERVFFTFADLENPEARKPSKLDWYAVMQLGYRQLPNERWLSSPLYHLSYDIGERPNPPIEILLDREPPDMDPEEDKRLDAEAAKEELRLEDATDRTGASVKNKMVLAFRTMPVGDSYWLDTGTLRIT